MSCPGNAEHRGIKFVLAPIRSSHDASMLCNECGALIKNVSFVEMEAVMGTDSEGIGEATEAQETDVELMKRCMSDAVILERDCFIKMRTHGDPFLILQIAFKLFDGREK